MKKCCLILLLAAVFCAVSAYIAGDRSMRVMNTALPEPVHEIRHTVVLDAGHGGEDSGAVAADGTLEKDLNLRISNDIAALFELFGVPYVPVRTTDISVCDDGLATIRARKRSDILNRYDLVNSTNRAILLSIHQNMFEEPQYWGTQVFYSGGDDSACALAQAIKDAVVPALQPDNKREVKPATDSIYLLYHAKTASVLVECGFLSNPAELNQLKTPEYEAQIGYFICKGLLNYLNA